MGALNYFQQLIPLLPEIYLLLSSVVLLLFGVYCSQRVTMHMVGSALLALALTMFVVLSVDKGASVLLNGMFLSDGFTAFTKLLILGGGMLVMLVSATWLSEGEGKPFEYILLMMLAMLGMMFMVSSNTLLAMYMGVEMAALAQYVLAASDRDNDLSTEAGLKYFLLGALSSGMMLFGITLVYGFAGTVNFPELALYFTGFVGEAGGAIPQAVTVGVVLILIGFCFKVSAVPFHMWTPDVYQGAPTPITAFFAVAPKVAAFALLCRLLIYPFADMISQWQQIIVFVSFASMALGALAALRQTNIKRLLAYSSISHAGFMLMGLAAGTISGAEGLLIYLTLYIFMSAGAFGCVLLMRRQGVYVEEISDLSGLSRSQPVIAFMLAVFMFSMAGIPPLAGFFAKMYVILPAIEAGLIWLAVVGLLSSVISCYYYLRVVKFMYFDESEQPFDAIMPISSRIGLALCSIVTVFFFLIPTPLVTHAKNAASLLLY